MHPYKLKVHLIPQASVTSVQENAFHREALQNFKTFKEYFLARRRRLSSVLIRLHEEADQMLQARFDFVYKLSDSAQSPITMVAQIQSGVHGQDGAMTSYCKH